MSNYLVLNGTKYAIMETPKVDRAVAGFTASKSSVVQCMNVTAKKKD